jgi:hypothetical protein
MKKIKVMYDLIAMRCETVDCCFTMDRFEAINCPDQAFGMADTTFGRV